MFRGVRPISRGTALLHPHSFSSFFFSFESTLAFTPLRVDSQDYGPIVDYARSGSSQFQWLLPANRNINAKWIARLLFPSPRPDVVYYSLSLSPLPLSFLFLLFLDTKDIRLRCPPPDRYGTDETVGRDARDGENIQDAPR